MLTLVAAVFLALWPAFLASQAVVAAGPALSVDATLDRHAISPDIYGMNFGDTTLVQELQVPVNRYGGNAASRYNYVTNVQNLASDWYFENYPLGLQAGDVTVDQFIAANRTIGTKPIVTMPLIGYVPRDDSPTNHPFFCSYPASAFPTQQSFDPYDPNCGNGKGTDTNHTPIPGANPLTTSKVVDQTYDAAWVEYLKRHYGSAANGGIQLYDLDNEPFIWNETHFDVRPTAVGYDDLRDRTYQYAAAIKQVDPGARTLGPSDWGWDAYFNSNSATDNRATHGGTDFGAWYLQQMHAYEQRHGVRILDYFDEHYYPQANGVTLGPAGSASTQALRLRSTRSLWDPAYIDESWIGQPVNLIPRFRQWIAANYPGTRFAIGEYNWGGLESLNGALAEADVLGIFGREGVDLAAIWDPPSASQPGAYAFRIYRNYDGHGSMYGDTWVRATSADQSQLAIYAAHRRSDQALTLVIINKTGASLQSTLSLSGFTPASNAQVYGYSGANLNAIVRQADMPVSASGFTATYPADSITLLVLPGGAPTTLPPARPNGPPQVPPPAPLPTSRNPGSDVGVPAPLPAGR